MQLVHLAFAAGPDQGDVQTLREAGFVADAAPGYGDLLAFVRNRAAGEVGDDEPRAPGFDDDLAVDLVVVLLLVDALRVVTRILDAGP